MSSLDDELLRAHARDDKFTLVDLYAKAADAAGSVDATCFYLTHAYIFALELDHPDVPKLHARLSEHGRV